MAQITRVTMIKIREQDIETALEGFQTFTKNQRRNGEPYILSMEAGAARGSIKDQGYTFVTKSVFKNMGDMQYYENDCEAHNEYKDFLKNNAPVSGLMSVNFEAQRSYTL